MCFTAVLCPKGCNVEKLVFLPEKTIEKLVFLIRKYIEKSENVYFAMFF